MKKMLSRLFSKIIFQLTPSSTLHGTSQETLIPLDSPKFSAYRIIFTSVVFPDALSPWMIVILRFITNS